MEVYGVSAPGKNASLAIVKDDQISFAALAKQYWRAVDARTLHADMVMDALDYADMPKIIAMDERPMVKRWRALLRRDFDTAFSMETPRDYLGEFWDEDHIDRARVVYYDRHYALACAGYYTSTFRNAAVVCIDVRDEVETVTVWDARDQVLVKVFEREMPYSDLTSLHLVSNIDVFQTAYELTKRRNLVFVGSAALRAQDNSLFASMWDFDKVWMLPNPVASSLGAALAYRNEWVEWRGPFLGHEIKRKPSLNGVITTLMDGRPVGLAHGRAEFTHHSMGNRALLADPMGMTSRLRVDKINGESAPYPVAILAEHFDVWFHRDDASRHLNGMFTGRCKRRASMPVFGPQGVGRVLAVSRESNPLLHDILTRWHAKSGCPMLINVPLAGRSEAAVNTWEDAEKFAHKYHMQVL